MGKQNNPLEIHLKGIDRTDTEDVKLYLNDKQLYPEESWKIRKHSPDGFYWGYDGSGPAQAALAICIELYGNTVAERVYQRFKINFLAPLPMTDFEETIILGKPWQKVIFLTQVSSD